MDDTLTAMEWRERLADAGVVSDTEILAEHPTRVRIEFSNTDFGSGLAALLRGFENISVESLEGGRVMVLTDT